MTDMDDAILLTYSLLKERRRDTVWQCVMLGVMLHGLNRSSCRSTGSCIKKKPYFMQHVVSAVIRDQGLQS